MSLLAFAMLLMLLPLGMDAQTFKEVKSKGNSTYVLKNDGTVWTAGRNRNHALGQNLAADSSRKFSKIAIPALVDELYSGHEFGVALTEEDVLWFWGNNKEFEGGNNSDSESFPLPTSTMPDQKWIELATGAMHVMAIKEDGTLWGWGSDVTGQLGDADPMLQQKPNPVQIGSDTDWDKLSAGYWQTLAIKKDGSLWGWGDNKMGQLGLGDGSPMVVTSPTRIGEDSDWSDVHIGSHHVLAIKKDGSLWSWGNNLGKQVNESASMSVNSPYCMSTEKWSEIAGGLEHSLAIKEDGSLWAVGSNRYGQLGVDISGNTGTLQRVGQATDWVEVAAGAYHSMAINSKGELYTFGRNDHGQLGLDLADESVSVPTQVVDESPTSMAALIAGQAYLSYDAKQSKLYLYLPATANLQSIDLFDLNARLIKRFSKDVRTIDSSNLAAASYFLRLSFADGSTQVLKFQSK